LGDRAGRGAEGDGHGLLGLYIKTEEGLEGFDGLFRYLVAMAAGLAFGVGAQVVGVDGQQIALEVAAGPSQHAQGGLEGLGALDGQRGEQVVDGLVGGHERQAVGQFEALLAERGSGAHAGQAQGRFVEDLQGQARLDPGAGAVQPGAKHIERPQSQVLGHEQPDADHRPRDLVGQQLAHAALQVSRGGRLPARASAGALGRHFERLTGRPKRVEFFFGGRRRQWCDRPSGC